MGKGLSILAERMSKGRHMKNAASLDCIVQEHFPRKLERKASRINLEWMFHGLLEEGPCTGLLGYVLKANQEKSKKSCTKERRRLSRRKKRVRRKQPQ